jgi:signal transduction histidine kinase
MRDAGARKSQRGNGQRRNGGHEGIKRSAIWAIQPPAPRFARGTRELDSIATGLYKAEAARNSEAASARGLREEDVVQIVHDLKTPLATIALETSLLDDRLTCGEPIELRPVIDRITRNVAYLDRVVHELLDLCAVDTDHFALDRVATELRTLLENVIARCVPTRDRARVVLEADSPVTLMIDDLRIERVVGNLLSNALKYAPRASAIIVRLGVGPDVVTVSVIDSGPGVPSDQANFIFEKYHRIAGSRCEGTGLGLYISKKIVEAHDGRIGVHSIYGAGARFYFELPLQS